MDVHAERLHNTSSAQSQAIFTDRNSAAQVHFFARLSANRSFREFL